MGFTIKYLLCCMDEIGDDDDSGYILFATCLIDATSNSKEFCFSTSDECCIMNYLSQRMIAYMYMQYRCSNVVLDASICYNDGCMW